MRFAPLPPNTILALGTKVVLLLLTLRVSEDAAVCESPTVKAIAPVLPPWLIVCAAMSEIVGAVFTEGEEFTIITKLSLLLSEPSLTFTVIVTVPV